MPRTERRGRARGERCGAAKADLLLLQGRVRILRRSASSVWARVQGDPSVVRVRVARQRGLVVQLPGAQCPVLAPARGP